MTAPPAGARGGAVLYTPDLLALAVSLAHYPLDPAMPYIGEARSRTCGNTLAVSLKVDEGDRIDAVGVRVSACAVGQGAAALFAKGAVGRTAMDISRQRDLIAAWLANGGELPGWPGLESIAPARAYPGRHGAILLAWDAALAALSKREARG
ncbi:hypothetical protein A6F68_02355 [Tsuneonella dongtanensis]|uniref:NIF system FeS cluster assembly NifU N-terminal domain-containing protein n=1 Tax=Tsuneonella dongtanensis TaxID=692370 RepID=A0A1B2AFD6_9SPHN|nr:iron-sulfur cluster assembly scaffold protein [Tsuneonella dongtanensis]ANY20854.1 hypothetical protein A6F68_02355 [Tsuneonella dongtanensis]